MTFHPGRCFDTQRLYPSLLAYFFQIKQFNSFFFIICTHNLPVHQAICFRFLLPDAFLMSRSCTTIP